MRWTPALLAVVLFLAVRSLASEPVAEQSVTPVTPSAEQRVEPISGAGEQHVETVDARGVQEVTGGNKGPVRRGAETAGKVLLGVTAAGVSIAFTVASLMFF